MGIVTAYRVLAKHYHHADGYTYLLEVKVNLYICVWYSLSLTG